MQLRIGDDLHDLDIRPLVIVRSSIAGFDDDDPVRSAKDAVGRGADLVTLPWSTLTGPVVSKLAAVGVPVVASPDGGDDAVPIDRFDALLVDGTARVTRIDGQVVFSRDAAVLRPGDGLIVPWDRRGPLARDGVAVIVDLTPLGDRAELAAVVADTLVRGASGFLTAAPEPVRRAAHVIRAVEHAA